MPSVEKIVCDREKSVKLQVKEEIPCLATLFFQVLMDLIGEINVELTKIFGKRAGFLEQINFYLSRLELAL